jgi:carbon monoxide dehydrogenase subunit G
MKLETNWESVQASQTDVFAFLSDMNNLQKLMPEQVGNWTSDTDTCQFTIKGMADLGMKITGRTPESLIAIASHGKSPFPFTLDIHIKAAGDVSEAQLSFNGEVNPFLKMMVEKPLGNFFNMLLDGLSKQFA